MPEKACLKHRLANGETLYGCFVMIPSPSVVEMVGFAGYDYVIIDREHGTTTTEGMEHQIRAAEASGMSAIVRIPAATTSEILCALDCGAEGILVPHIQSAETANAIVQAAYYPPHGTRGMATTTRAGRHGMVDAASHIARALEQTLVMLQIEDESALPHVREIAEVANVSSVFIGPADLAASLGHAGNPGHPTVVAARNGIIGDVKAANGPVLSSFARSAEDAKSMAEEGIRMVTFSTTTIFSGALRSLIKEVER